LRKTATSSQEEPPLNCDGNDFETTSGEKKVDRRATGGGGAIEHC